MSGQAKAALLAACGLAFAGVVKLVTDGSGVQAALLLAAGAGMLIAGALQVRKGGDGR